MYVKIFHVNAHHLLYFVKELSVDTTVGYLSHCTFWCALCKQFNKSVNFCALWPHYECVIGMWNWQRDLDVAPLRALYLSSVK
jgi:hypothetical protein